MPLKLIAPGKRKGNPYWIARGRIGGRLYEVSTNETDKSAAEASAAQYTVKIIESSRSTAPEELTFAQTSARYEGWRPPNALQKARIKRLNTFFGNKRIGDIQHDDLVAAADFLYRGKKASTRNRCVITIAGAVLHYAASNGWCAYRRFPRFKEPKPVTRAVAVEDMPKLVAGAEGDARRLLIVLFGLGQRITATLQIAWTDIDQQARTVSMTIGKKGGERRVFPLPDQVFEALDNSDDKTGFVFPWRTRGGAYKALREATTASKVRFTPHMARHTLGTLLNASGAGLKTIMATLGHNDAKSSLRYQDANTEIVRAAHLTLARYIESVGKPVGKMVKA